MPIVMLSSTVAGFYLHYQHACRHPFQPCHYQAVDRGNGKVDVQSPSEVEKVTLHNTFRVLIAAFNLASSSKFTSTSFSISFPAGGGFVVVASIRFVSLSSPVLLMQELTMSMPEETTLAAEGGRDIIALTEQ
jgi:hypothetical protein